MSDRRLFVFDRYRLDERERQLLLGTRVVALPPKLFDLLAVLVRNPGRLLQKQDLLDEVWAGVAVEEGSLTRGISSLRSVLGTMADGQDYIETVPKRGYRFASPVQEASSDDSNATRPGLAMPSSLAEAGVDFVGREAELAEMDDVWRRAKGGLHQLLLIAGEPGIGKTRLSLEFARRASAEGSTVLIGYNDEENLVPYQPFVECLSWYIRHCPLAELRDQLVPIGGGSELGPLVPELRARIPDLPNLPPVDPEGQRYRLFEAVATMLAAASRSRPMLLILDDLHWADRPTLLLLRHIMRSARAGAFVIIATYRESELGRMHPLAEMLTTLRRERGITRIVLRGLDIAQVRGLVDSLIGPDAPAPLPQMILDYTGGNPFFVTEMLQHLGETKAIARFGGFLAGTADVSDLGLSEGIKEVVGRRLSRLSDNCNRMLSLACIIGREFDATLLEAVLDFPDGALLDALEEASRAQLIRESPGVRGRFEFTHALIRETLYSELSSPRRVKLHRRVADAIERLTALIPTSPLAELAYHFSQAASADVADKAIEYATRAGDRAADGLAHEEAARLFDMALHSLEFKAAGVDADRLRVDLHTRRARCFDALGRWMLEVRELEAALGHLNPEQVEHRCELMLALARASFLLLDVRPVEGYATEALQLAERLQRSDLAANAIGWLARCRQADGDLRGAIEMDRRAMSRAPGVTTAAHMLGPLSLYLAGQSASAIRMSIEAADAARLTGDTTFIMYALSHVGLNMAATGHYAEASKAFHEVRSFGRKYGALPMLARATAMAAGLHLTLFDFEGAEALQSEASELARSVGFVPPIVSAGIDSLLTLARRHDPGRAERLIEETVAAAASTAGWHQWLWQLRLTQAKAELALARDRCEEAIATASNAIEQSRARGRPKYEALGLVTRAHALDERARTQEAIGDARHAVSVAERVGDPALLLLATDALIELDGTDQLVKQACATIDRIHDALPDEAIRRRFTDSEVVQRIRKYQGGNF